MKKNCLLGLGLLMVVLLSCHPMSPKKMETEKIKLAGRIAYDMQKVHISTMSALSTPILRVWTTSLSRVNEEGLFTLYDEGECLRERGLMETRSSHRWVWVIDNEIPGYKPAMVIKSETVPYRPSKYKSVYTLYVYGCIENLSKWRQIGIDTKRAFFRDLYNNIHRTWKDNLDITVFGEIDRATRIGIWDEDGAVHECY